MKKSKGTAVDVQGGYVPCSQNTSAWHGGNAPFFPSHETEGVAGFRFQENGKGSGAKNSEISSAARGRRGCSVLGGGTWTRTLVKYLY